MPSPVCVFCRREPAQPPWAPFCSERCKLQDLARWINGNYRVAGEPVTHDTDLPGDAPSEDTNGRSRG